MKKLITALILCASLWAQSSFRDSPFFPAVSAPATPGAGFSRCYIDSGTKLWSCKDDAGTITTGATPAGATGSIQTNAGSGVFGAIVPATGMAAFLATPSSANLNFALTTKSGSGLTVFNDHPTFAGMSLGVGPGTITRTAGTTGTTAGLLVKYDSSGNVVTAATTDTGVIGVAVSTATLGNPVEVVTAGIASTIVDNTSVIGNFCISGTSTAGRCRDAGTADPIAIATSVQIHGIFRSVATVGNSATIEAFGPGHYGAQVTGGGSVSDFSVVTANGVSASVANSTTTPAATFTLGAITPTTVKGLTITTTTGTFTLTNGKTLSVLKTLSLDGTDGTTMIFPSTSAAIARMDAGQTFTGVQTMTSPALTTPAITGLATGSGVATANTVSTLVARDPSGNFAAGTITATLTGNVTGNVTGNASGTAATITGLLGSANIPKIDVLDASRSCSDAGSTDTYACNLSPAITAYVTNTHYTFKANTINTGAASINFNAVGAKTIVKVAGGITTALADGDIRAGQGVDLLYDGTNMQMQSTLGNASSGGSGTPCTTTALSFQYNNAGGFGCIGTLTTNGTDVTMSSGTIDLSAATVLIPNSAISTAYLNGLYSQLAAANVHTAGATNSFSHNATLAGFRLVPQAGDPSTPSDGTLWYNSSTPALRARINGATVSLSGGGGSGTVTSATIAGTTNQIVASGTCTITVSGTCTLSIPSGVVLTAPVLGTPASVTLTNATGYPAASTASSGIAEAAIASEVTTGADTLRYISPDALRGSDYGKDIFAVECIADATALSTGDGKCYIGPITAKHNGWNIVSVVAGVGAAVSSSGAVTVDIDRCGVVATGVRCSGTNVSIFSTLATIDANEDSTSTAATANVINASNDDLTTDQWLRVNIDGAGTSTQGLYVWVTVQKP